MKNDRFSERNEKGEVSTLNSSTSLTDMMWLVFQACGMIIILLIIWNLLRGMDSYWNVSSRYFVQQISHRLWGEPTEAEKEAKVLIDYAAEKTQVDLIRWLSVWDSDELEKKGVEGQFNPLLFKMTVAKHWSQRLDFEQRWLIFHETGHAVQWLTGRRVPAVLPEWGWDLSTAQHFQESMVYQQVYAETFADIFALTLALDLDPKDPHALNEVKKAKENRVDVVSMAHDTKNGVVSAYNMIETLQGLKGLALLNQMDRLASAAALVTVRDWGGEKEAWCLTGAIAKARWLIDGGHMNTTNPWVMWPEWTEHEYIPQEALQIRQTIPFKGTGYKREWIEKEVKPFYQEILQRSMSSEFERTITLDEKDTAFDKESPLRDQKDFFQRGWAQALARYESQRLHSGWIWLYEPVKWWSQWELNKKPECQRSS